MTSKKPEGQFAKLVKGVEDAMGDKELPSMLATTGGWVTEDMIDEVNAMGKPNPASPAHTDEAHGQGAYGCTVCRANAERLANRFTSETAGHYPPPSPRTADQHGTASPEGQTCGWVEEDDDGLPNGGRCDQPATHYSCNSWKAGSLNACKEHKCRCAPPARAPAPAEARPSNCDRCRSTPVVNQRTATDGKRYWLCAACDGIWGPDRGSASAPTDGELPPRLLRRAEDWLSRFLRGKSPERRDVEWLADMFSDIERDATERASASDQTHDEHGVSYRVRVASLHVVVSDLREQLARATGSAPSGHIEKTEKDAGRPSYWRGFRDGTRVGYGGGARVERMASETDKMVIGRFRLALLKIAHDPANAQQMALDALDPQHVEKSAAPSTRYRVGRKVGNTLYLDDQFVGSCVSAEAASALVEATRCASPGRKENDDGDEIRTADGDRRDRASDQAQGDGQPRVVAGGDGRATGRGATGSHSGGVSDSSSLEDLREAVKALVWTIERDMLWPQEQTYVSLIKAAVARGKAALAASDTKRPDEEVK